MSFTIKCDKCGSTWTRVYTELKTDLGDVILTGETNLDISKEELIERVLKNVHGEDYLEVLDVESSILIRQGLFEGYIKDYSSVFFKIPNWDAFISAVNVFYVRSRPRRIG